MTRPLSFDDLQAILHQHIADLPDIANPAPIPVTRSKTPP